MWEVNMNSPTAPLSSPSTTTNVLIKVIIVDSRSGITGSDLIPLVENTTCPTISRSAKHERAFNRWRDCLATEGSGAARSSSFHCIYASAYGSRLTLLPPPIWSIK